MKSHKYNKISPRGKKKGVRKIKNGCMLLKENV